MNTYYYSTKISFDSCYNLLIVGLTLESNVYRIRNSTLNR